MTAPKRVSALRSSQLLLLSLAFGSGLAQAQAQGQGFAAVGPTDASNGYPTSYTDHNGLALVQCLVTPNDPANPIVDPCGLTGTLPGGDNSAIVFPSNFPEEFFFSRLVGRIKGVGTTAAKGLAANAKFPKKPAPGADPTPAEVLDAKLALAAKGGGDRKSVV